MDGSRTDEAPFFSDVDDGPEGGRAYWLHADDGVRIRAGVWPLDGAKGTVLLFPGRTEYIEKYGRAAGDLAARGYATLAIDWRGQGIAERLVDDPLKGHVGVFSDYQRDVRAVLALAATLDLPQPWHLIGHSMGGCIGLRALHEGLPVASAVFTGPMWGILIPAAMRPVAWLLSSTASLMGLGGGYAPGTVRDAYVLANPFEGNNLTKDREMYDYMIRQTRAHPDVALAGPTLNWLYEALKETRDLARLRAPAYPCLTFVGADEDIVDVPAIEAQIAKWPGARLEHVPLGEHEVMMDGVAARTRLFDAMAAHFDAHGEPARG
ncbi:alpha/beta hydrolase [Pseudooceanicola sp. LIPI14-2-Ac024]|uniref:alpha/beta hydrolase n=1 Tax=Pseudooceanicola sp. LIPI14-2-Ac024 TaxID=3344875 RepID=UPI0035CF57C7